MPVLHQMQMSGNCYKIRLAARQLGVPLTLKNYGLHDGTTRKADFLAKNPNGRVPALELEDGRTLPESGAILWYLGENTFLVPDDRWGRAEVLQWMFFEQYDHEPAIAVVRFWVAYSGRAAEFADRLDERRGAGYRALTAMERHLATHEFFVGNSPTLADIALFAYTHVADEGGFDLGRYPAIRDWVARVAAMPGHIPIDA